MIPRCDNRDEWLGPHLYGDLPFTEGAAAEEHLEGCAACAGEAASLRGVLESLPPPEPAPPIATRRGGAWRLAAAAALLAAALGFAGGRASSPAPVAPNVTPARPSPPPAAAAAAPAPMSVFSPAMLAYLGGKRDAGTEKEDAGR